MEYFRPLAVSSTGVAFGSGGLTSLAGLVDVGFSHAVQLSRDEGRAHKSEQRSDLITVDDLTRNNPLIAARLCSKRASLPLKGGEGLSLDQPRIMGILNVTPDSFFDGGAHNQVDDAVRRALLMIEEGATIIDIGGESTRPGADIVSVDEELSRVVPVIEKLHAEADVLISIDSRKADVMTAAVKAGAGLINDVSALTFDEGALAAAVAADVPVVLMHAQGTPQTMQKQPQYGDVLLDVYDYLDERIEVAIKAGISREKLIVDPGIGFGKTLAHNCALMQGLSVFHGLGVAVLLGCSRKSFISALSKSAGLVHGVEASERLSGSLAGALKGVAQGVQIFRVHDVKETAQALAVWRCGS